MQSFSLYARDGEGLFDAEIRAALAQSLEGCALRRVLLLPPDHTRLHSGAGRIVRILWELLSSQCEVDVMPALGTHVAMTEAEWREMYAPIPYEKMIVHNWRADVARIGEVPAAFVREVSEGWMDEPVAVEVNRRLLDPSYDLILSIGQVVPHEVVGMANQTKNLFVGCGGAAMINASHMLGARYGLERIMGRDRTPVRAVFDYAESHFLQGVPVVYLLTVTTAPGDDARIHGLFAGRERTRFEEAVRLSQEKNVFYVDPAGRARGGLAGSERVQVHVAGQQGRLPHAHGDGRRRRAADPRAGRRAVRRGSGHRRADPALRLPRARGDPRAGARALRPARKPLRRRAPDPRLVRRPLPHHLLHAPPLRRRGARRRLRLDFLDEAVRRFDPARLQPGWNDLPDGPAYFIPNPALGLWSARKL